MFSPYVWLGTVTEASPTRISITDFAGQSAIYIGSYRYNASDLVGGVVTGYESYYNFGIDYRISGLMLDAMQVKRYLDIGDALGLTQYAASGNDLMIGSSLADTIVGWSGNDTIYGQIGNDNLFGLDGNDTLIGGLGNDFLVGGSGTDYAYFSGTFEQYTGGITPEGWIEVRDSVANRDGTDYLAEIERLRFSDTDLALDIDGVAGQAYRIYEAVLGRAPDVEGLGYWIKDMDSGVSLTTVAQGFVASKEFTDKYGVNPTYETYINLLYKNILDRAPDAEGLKYWVSNMERGLDSPAVVLASFSEGIENRNNVAPDIAGGIFFTPWIT